MGLGDVDGSEYNHDMPSHNQRTMSNFGLSRNSGAEDEATAAGTSTTHSVSIGSDKGGLSHVSVSAPVGGRWWDKLIIKDKRFFSAANQQAQRREQLEMEERELERPTDSLQIIESAIVNGLGHGTTDGLPTAYNTRNNIAVIANATATPTAAGVPGRRTAPAAGRDARARGDDGGLRALPPRPARRRGQCRDGPAQPQPGRARCEARPGRCRCQGAGVAAAVGGGAGHLDPGAERGAGRRARDAVGLAPRAGLQGH